MEYSTVCGPSYIKLIQVYSMQFSTQLWSAEYSLQPIDGLGGAAVKIWNDSRWPNFEYSNLHVDEWFQGNVRNVRPRMDISRIYFLQKWMNLERHFPIILFTEN